jgi:hypothetical protein
LRVCISTRLDRRRYSPSGSFWLKASQTRFSFGNLAAPGLAPISNGGAFIDALTIVVMGHKVGSWAVRLLATKEYELADRVADLRDSDLPFNEEPSRPAWLADHNDKIVGFFPNHPTLEPAVTLGNEDAMLAALTSIELTPPSSITGESIHELFRSTKKANEKNGTPAVLPDRAHPRASLRWH